jgi:hypothetical protein
LVFSELLVASTGAALAESSRTTNSAIAASKPNRATVERNCLPFTVIVRAFMTPVSRRERLAAMTIIIIFLPYPHSLISGCRTSRAVVKFVKFVYADNAACSSQSICRNSDRLPRELPERDERAHNQECVDYRLEDVAALFFGAPEKRVRGLVLVL